VEPGVTKKTQTKAKNESKGGNMLDGAAKDEPQMTRAARNAELKKAKNQQLDDAWIPFQTGVIVIAVVSVALGVFTAWQAIPIKGPVEGVLWGVVFGGSIWLIFFGNYLFHRLARRGKNSNNSGKPKS
jgi:sterol desaturase/sphingolipid hydroxylase (fatty acid hydroxylase superfamily)